MQNRLPWDQYFLQICYLVAERSTCVRRKIGAIAVKNRRILATGYNGAPSGIRHCTEIGCLREQLRVPTGHRHEICRGLHAEQNVIIQAALHGVALQDADLYCITQPCLICSKMLINCGVRSIAFCELYPDSLSEEMIKEAGIPFRPLWLKHIDKGL